MIRRVLVTGGAGYVGSVLVPELLLLGYRVRVLDLCLYVKALARSAMADGLQVIKGDIRDKGLVKSALNGIDAVIHLACISNDPSFELDPLLGKSINYDATNMLIDLSKQSGVKRFIYASSSSVYGIQKAREVTEAVPVKPLTDYSKYKALCEVYLHRKCSKSFVTFALRPATVCGYSPRMRLDLIVNIFAIQALVNRTITVFGGTQLRPNIHIRDMAAAYVMSLRLPDGLVLGKTYNVGYENRSLMELADYVKEVLGDTRISVRTTPTNDRRSYHISSRAIEKDLGFGAKHSIQEAIADIARAYENKLLPRAMTDVRYYNVNMMRKIKLR